MLLGKTLPYRLSNTVCSPISSARPSRDYEYKGISKAFEIEKWREERGLVGTQDEQGFGICRS